MFSDQPQSPGSPSAVIILGMVLGVQTIVWLLYFLFSYFLHKDLAPILFLLATLFLVAAYVLRKNRDVCWGLVISFLLVKLLSFYFIKPMKNKDAFAKLDQVKSFSERLLKQTIELENSNLLKPVYDKYYQAIIPSRFSEKLQTIFTIMHLKKMKAWSPASFISLLEKVLVEAAKRGCPKFDYIAKYSLTEQSKVVVFGNIQGAFDSVVRDCEKLKDLGIIDEDFKIKAPGDFIVVLGDAVSRSPYQLETLSLLFRLYLNNPGQFIYLKGNHEADNYWQEFNLKSELYYRINPCLGTSVSTPLEKEINTFFSQLPLGVYFALPDKEDPGFLRITYYGADRSPMFIKESENKFGKFLGTPAVEGKGEFCPFAAVREEVAGKDISLKAIIKGEKKRETYQDMDGLRLLQPEGGVTAWTVISCPTEVYQKGLKFFYDAFVVITFGKTTADYKITLYNQDVRSKPGFTPREQSLVSGKEASSVVKKETKEEVSKDKKVEPSKNSEDKSEGKDKEDKKVSVKKESSNPESATKKEATEEAVVEKKTEKKTVKKDEDESQLEKDKTEKKEDVASSKEKPKSSKDKKPTQDSEAPKGSESSPAEAHVEKAEHKKEKVVEKEDVLKEKSAQKTKKTTED